MIFDTIGYYTYRQIKLHSNFRFVNKQVRRIRLLFFNFRND
ncbi:hypothetical protein THF1C08_30450 [Vibrio jasicida]|uniref:Uncharacterized protein n=1 Tax=Vibrio jasicida TaxID=766224 RepID=A0AAU9QIC7_9VIBR|nr:hypothetical protein THF1A12_180018 [Vibrio jasicida]CAH1590860.1 hypothetical protein THF1C08_30450 [Vibrio jasicida]